MNKALIKHQTMNLGVAAFTLQNLSDILRWQASHYELKTTLHKEDVTTALESLADLFEHKIQDIYARVSQLEELLSEL